jgi:hypothetical protein
MARKIFEYDENLAYAVRLNALLSERAVPLAGFLVVFLVLSLLLHACKG